MFNKSIHGVSWSKKWCKRLLLSHNCQLYINYARFYQYRLRFHHEMLATLQIMPLLIIICFCPAIWSSNTVPLFHYITSCVHIISYHHNMNHFYIGKHCVYIYTYRYRNVIDILASIQAILAPRTYWNSTFWSFLLGQFIICLQSIILLFYRFTMDSNNHLSIL